MQRLTALALVLVLAGAALAPGVPVADALLQTAAPATVDRSLVYIRTAGENGPSLTGAGLELATEIPGGFLAFLTDADLADLTAWGIAHVIVAKDDPATEVLIQYEVGAGDRITPLADDAQILHRERDFAIVRMPYDEERILSCLPDIQRVFRRPLRFVSTPWEGPAPDKLRSADPAIAAMVETVTQGWLQDQVQILQDFGTRHSQQNGGLLASYWLRDQFLAYGYTDVTLHSYNTWNDNVVCVKPGTVTPEKYVVIGGHYDSITSTPAVAPGADDNATGTVAVLAAARAMADYEFEHSVVFLAFSGEEQGLYGSAAWASEAAAAGLDIVGALVMDMLGYRAAGDAADIDIISNASSQPLRDLIDEVITLYVPDHVAVTGSLPFGASSDHASFWNNGYRAILFFEDSGQYSPYIHTVNDIIGPSVNDVAFMNDNVRTAVAATAALARVFSIAIVHDPLTHSQQNGPFEVSCRIIAAEPLDPASLQLHYRSGGSSFTTVALTASGEPDVFLATIPAQPSGILVEYYLSAADQLGRTAVSPDGAPAETYAFRPGLEIVLDDDGEEDLGWTLGLPSDTATSGLWVRDAPVATTYQPGEDHTPPPGTICFVTGNGVPGGSAGAEDVDGGHTTLLSPVFDLAGAVWAEISYWCYYVLATSLDDVFRVDISNNGGTSWVNLQTLTASTGGWLQGVFELDGSGLALTDQMQLRFIAEDIGQGSLVEALVDDIVIVCSRGSVAVEAVPPLMAHLQAYPNPFNPQTTLGFALPQAGFAEIKVFDARGRQVARPLAAPLPAGGGEVLWQAPELASGIYLVQILLDGEVLKATKLTLVR